MDSRDERLLRSQKRQLVLALFTTCLMAAVLATMAWLNHTRSLSTATEVWVPTLWLDDVHGVDMMDLGEIDTNVAEDNALRRRYVFAVCSNNDESYHLQLAHTNNIGFTFRIYGANEVSAPPAAGYQYVPLNVGGADYYYEYSGDAPLTDGGTTGTAHGETYKRVSENPDAPGETRESIYPAEKVHKDAEAVYWKSGEIRISDSHVDYYVLEVSWTESVTNTKETDMVYLLAQTATDQNVEENA